MPRSIAEVCVVLVVERANTIHPPYHWSVAAPPAEPPVEANPARVAGFPQAVGESSGHRPQ